MLLAIDTATRVPSLALYDGERVVAEETWRSANGHTVELVPGLVRVLERQRVSPAELKGIAVALGPGSFTGLRIGLGIAKGLALTLAYRSWGYQRWMLWCMPRAASEVPCAPCCKPVGVGSPLLSIGGGEDSGKGRATIA